MNLQGSNKFAQKTGGEKFTGDGASAARDLLSFWRWSSSDVVGNAMRGVLAEYIVAAATGCTGGVRQEWDAIDLVTGQGIKIEVKSSAYIQSWPQEKPASIKFSIQPTRGWHAATNTSSAEKTRQADVYVFAVLAHQNKQTINPLNLEQWEFYILSTAKLNELVGDQQKITLSSLKKLSPIECRFAGIDAAIKEALAVNASIGASPT